MYFIKLDYLCENKNFLKDKKEITKTRLEK